MYLFEVWYQTKNVTKRSKGIEVEEFYDLGEAWHVAIDTAIKSTADDERLDSIELIAW